jgi:hypothetical protein
MGFAAYWRWKSRPRGGGPRIGKEVRDLIRRMSFENPLWGATKIHGELLNVMDALRASIDAEEKKAPAPSTRARRPAKKKASR